MTDTTVNPLAGFPLSPGEMRALSFAELQQHIELDADVVFCYSPESLRDVCHGAFGSCAVADLLAATLDDLVTRSDYGSATHAFIGFKHPMTGAQFLRAMLEIANAARKFRGAVLPSEVGYEDWMAEEKARAACREAKCTEARLRLAQAASAADVTVLREPAERFPEAVECDPEASVAHVDIEVRPEGEDLEVTLARIDARRAAERDASKKDRVRRVMLMSERPQFVLVDEGESSTVQSIPLKPVEGRQHELCMPVAPAGCVQLPHLLTRSALIATGAKNKARASWPQHAPRVVTKVSGFATGTFELRYSGKELRTGDIELWAKLLEIAARRTDDQGHRLPACSRVTVRERDLIKALNRGKRPGGPAFKALREERERLQAAMLHIRSTDKAFLAQMGALFQNDKAIQEAVQHGVIELRTRLLGGDVASERSWTIQIPRLVRTMFGDGFSSWIDEATYYSLKGDQARRLYMLYASHVDCYALSLPELREFLGSTYGADSDLRAAMDEAHNELKAAGVIYSWQFKQTNRRKLNAACYEVKRRVKPRKTVPGGA